MKKHLVLAVIAGASLFSSRLPALETKPLETIAEASAWTKTGRYEEAAKLCHEFEKKFPGRAKCEKFGTSPEGRALLALVVSEAGALTPSAAARKKLPVLLAQGAIHAGECDGKDAGFFLLRELLEHKTQPGVLKKVVVVFVPIFNVDGHERFGAYNRPNQRGPEEMGWRVTARNLNLNRDYVKGDAPEMQAMLGLLDAWDPIVYADLHVTDGADFQHDIAVIIDPAQEGAGPTELREEGARLSAGLMVNLKSLGHLPLAFYPDFRVDDDPSSGFEVAPSTPRYSDAYWGIRNRFGVLVETHSWKNYAVRVHATIHTLSYLLDSAARDGARWLEAAHLADGRAKEVAGKPITLTYESDGKSHPIEFLGYEYKREHSDISGDLMTSYDPSKNKTLTLPMFDTLKPKLVVSAPAHGYYVPAAWAEVVEPKLRLHALEYRKLTATQSLDVESFRCLEPQFAAKSYEGRQGLTLKGAWAADKREVLAGSLFVPIAQARSDLLMQLLEPEAPDSLASWGFFNAHFERKEYMEAYVAEQVARGMLARDPAVKAEFDHKLATDPAFAKDPARRLEFFAQKHASWDERFGLYPIFRN